MTEKFYILRLPLLVQKKIFAQVDFWKKIHLTMKIAKFRQLMELFKINVDLMTFNIENDGFRIVLQNDTSPVYLQFIMSSDDEFPKTWKFDNIKVGVCHVLVLDVNKTIYVDCETNEEEEMMELVTRSLFKMLKVKKFHLKIEDDFKNCFIWNYIPQFESIDYKESKFTPTGQVQLPFGAINVKNLTFTVQNSNPAWSQETFAKNSEAISLKPIKSASELIYQWKIGYYEQLETLVVKHTTCYVPYPRISEMVETENAVVDRDVIEAYYPAAQEVFHIRRETDGLRATIAIRFSELKLIVWTEERVNAAGPGFWVEDAP